MTSYHNLASILAYMRVANIYTVLARLSAHSVLRIATYGHPVPANWSEGRLHCYSFVKDVTLDLSALSAVHRGEHRCSERGQRGQE